MGQVPVVTSWSDFWGTVSRKDFTLFNLEGTRRKRCAWGFSSAGRAPALQAGGHRFESGNLHQGWIEVFGQQLEHFDLVLGPESAP